MEKENCICGQKGNCVNYPTETTDLNSEPFRGSFQQLLNNNIGAFVSIEFMLSTCEMRTISGYIESVTGRCVSLRTPKSNCRVVGDAWSIKTITFPCCES